MNEYETKKYDGIIIGAGPAGYTAAIRAAKLGKTIALIEKDRLGGTCLNKGCIPTKTMMHSVNLIREFRDAGKFGIRAAASPASVNEMGEDRGGYSATDTGLKTGVYSGIDVDMDVDIDINGLLRRRNDVVDKLVSGIETLIKSNGVDFYQGEAVIEAERVRVWEDYLWAPHVFVASGSVPARPPIPGIDLPGVFTSDDLLGRAEPVEDAANVEDATGSGSAGTSGSSPEDLLKLKSIAIIGGGVIGLELASIYNGLGCNVTIIEAENRVLPQLSDKEISQTISMTLKKRGVNINTGATVESIESAEAAGTAEQVGDAGAEEFPRLRVNYIMKDQPSYIDVEGVLVAVGRKLCSVTGVSDKQQAGNNFKIHFIGEAGHSVQLAHAAMKDANDKIDEVFGTPSSRGNLPVIPSCIYTDPEIASVGLTESQVKEQGIDYFSGKSITGSNGKTLIEDGDRGFVRLIFESESRTLIGAQLVCKRATDMIGGLGAAIAAKSTIDDILAVAWPHPTFSEMIGEAAEAAKAHSR